MTLIACIAPVAVHAQFAEKIRSGVQSAGGQAGISSTPPLEQIIGGLIQTAITLVGVILLIFLLYAGFLWMTAGGNEDQVKKAKSMIKNALIGMVIIVLAYAITDFILARLVETTSGGGTGGTTPAQ